jgi:4'-phosphopantetheinyl transferase
MSIRSENHYSSAECGHPALLAWEPGADVPELRTDEIRVWIIELDAGVPLGADIDSAEPGPELAQLSDDERTRAARFIRARDRRRFTRCRAALREILGRVLREPASSLRFRAAAVGKPELDRGQGVVEPLRFNVSHAAELGLVAVCRGREIGVDLERLRPITEAERIVASFFSPAEQLAFAAIAEPARVAAFVRGWTRKEAVLKGFGMGISGLAAQHETGFGTSALTSRFKPIEPSSQVDRWRLWEAAPRPEFVATIAVDVGDPPLLGCSRSGEAADASLPARPPTP